MYLQSKPFLVDLLLKKKNKKTKNMRAIGLNRISVTSSFNTPASQHEAGSLAQKERDS